jgi:putative MATE family efflux protein
LTPTEEPSVPPSISPHRVLPLALPVLAENVLLMAVNWSDMILAGRILEEPRYLAAITVAAYLVWFLKGISDIVGVGVFAVAAREIGARRPNEANRAAAQAVQMAFALGLALAFIVYFTADFISSLLAPQGLSVTLAADYLRHFCWAIPLDMVMLVGVNCLRAAGYTAAGMFVGFGVNIVNVALCWMLTVGAFGIPKFGWIGIALGASTAFALGGVVVLFVLMRGVGVLKIPGRPSPPNFEMIVRILRVGVPAATATIGLILCHLAFVAIIARLGEQASAAHGVAIQVESLSYLMGEAFAAATGALVGQALGAGRPDLAKACGRAGMKWAALFMGAMGVFFFALSTQLCGLFSPRPEVTELGGQVMRLMALAEAPLGVLIVGIGVLRGSGDTGWLLFLNLTSMLAVRLPLAVLFTSSTFGWGLWGAWLAMFFDVNLRAIIAYARFRHGGWTTKRV